MKSCRPPTKPSHTLTQLSHISELSDWAGACADCHFEADIELIVLWFRTQINSTAAGEDTLQNTFEAKPGQVHLLVIVEGY